MAKLSLKDGALSLKEKAPPLAGPKLPKKHFSAKDKPVLFDELLPCIWRDVHFPVTSLSLSFEHDLVEHKYWNVASADVEATGRAPAKISADIPFVNGIVPGKNERWGVLYPNTFRDFLKAFVDASTGGLQHPELGWIDCKPHSLDFKHEGEVRNGVIVQATWVETISQNINDLDPSAIGSSPIQSPIQVATDLDAALKEAKDPSLAVPDVSFEQLVNSVAGAIDTTTSKLSLLLNKPNQILFRLKKLQESVDRAGNVLLWPVQDGIHKLEEALGPEKIAGTGPTAKKSTRPIGRFKTTTRTTLAMLQARFSNNTVDDLIFLNPRLVARPTVPANTVIRHYQ
jgi:hypothetical protein